MASDGQSVKIPAANLVHGSQAPTGVVARNSGNVLPQSGLPSGKSVTPPAVKRPDPAPKSDLQAQLTLLNKFLNDSGRATEFRASADARAIEEINPATGAVVAQYPAAEFAALAKSVGISGGIINEVV